jgi:hypothetical protein
MPYSTNCVNKEFTQKIATNENTNKQHTPLDNNLLIQHINCFEHQICQLQTQLDYLESLILKPQIIKIISFCDIKLKYNVITYKDQLDSLFFEADIPLYWIIDSRLNKHKNDATTKSHCKLICEQSDIVYVTLLNHHVKRKTIEMLKLFFDTKYDNKIYIS